MVDLILDPIGDILAPHAETFNRACSIMGTLFAVPGALVSLNIVRRKTSDDVQPMGFIMGTMMCTIFFQYALIQKNAEMITGMVIALTLNTTYLLTHYFFLTDKMILLKPLRVVMLILLVLISYLRFIAGDMADVRFGQIMIVVMFGAMGERLFKTKEIMRERLGHTFPLPMTIFHTVFTLLWILNGLATKDKYMVFQNLLGMSMLSLQWFLIIFYSGGGKGKKEMDGKEE